MVCGDCGGCSAGQGRLEDIMRLPCTALGNINILPWPRQWSYPAEDNMYNVLYNSQFQHRSLLHGPI